jgi:hypothetical protein
MGLKLTDEQRDLVERFTNWVIRRGMTVPAILFLETIKPLSFLASQAVVVGRIPAELIFDRMKIEALIGLLEDRKNVELVLREVERKDAEVVKRAREMKTQEKMMRQQMKETRRLEKQRLKEQKKK